MSEELTVIVFLIIPKSPAFAETTQNFVCSSMHTVHPLGVDLDSCAQCDAGSLEIGTGSFLVIGLDKIVQMVNQPQSPGVLGGDLIFCS